jgi:cobalt-zinc-cadmium efflux system outer membrane protein
MLCRWTPRRLWLGCLTCWSVGLLGLAQAMGAPPADSARPLKLEEAVQQALRDNPQLAALRQQHGVAAAAVVIARTYPFNPVYQALVMAAGGPSDAGITNRIFNEHYVRLDLELRGQRKHREAAALSALSRADWDIATQELAVAVGTIRAFQTVVYRDLKLKVLEETVRLNERTVEQVRRLADAGKLRATDVILARTEVDAARAGLGQGRTALAVALSALQRSLGALGPPYELQGDLTVPIVPADGNALAEAAAQQRPDVQSRRSAIDEADARLRLEYANRFGNPSIGPAMEYNETSVTFVGMIFQTPLPVLNTRQGEIQQRKAEQQRALMDLVQAEVQARQDVEAALMRLAQARAWANSYQKDVLPSLDRSRQQLEKLFAAGEPGVDVLRLIDVQRKYLKAYDSALDARYEVCQATADLAAAVGDPSLAAGPSLPPPPAPTPHP